MKKSIVILCLLIAVGFLMMGIFEVRKMDAINAEAAIFLCCVSVLFSTFITIAIFVNWFWFKKDKDS